MKQLLFYISIFCTITIAYGQQWKKVLKIEGNKHELVTGIVLTPEEDIIATGIYQGIADVRFESADSSEKKFVANQPPSYSTLFVARYTKKGEIKWVINASAHNGIHPKHVNCDNQGNIIVCGSFEGIAVFNSANGQTKTIKGMPSIRERETPPHNYFVAKYNSDGNLLWVKAGLSKGNSFAFESVIDKENNIYVRGYCYGYDGEISFDTYTLSSHDSAGNYYQGFGLLLLKYSPQGEEEWIAWGDNNFHIREMCINEIGHLVLRGAYYGREIIATTFGKIYTLNSEHPTNAAFHFNEKGELIQVLPDFPTVLNGYVDKSVRDKEGNYYAFVLPNPTEPKRSFSMTCGDKKFNTKWYDIFLAKFDKEQHLLWITQFEGANEEKPLNITLDKNGNIIIAGHYRSQIKIKDITGDSIELHSIYKTMFLSSFTADGILKWACNSGNLFKEFYDEPLHITASSDNQLIVAGLINTPSEFGKIKVEVAGEKGWQSPGWKEKIDYNTYTDGFIGIINLNETKNIDVTLNLKLNQKLAVEIIKQTLAEIKKEAENIVNTLNFDETTVFSASVPKYTETVNVSDNIKAVVFPNPASSSQSEISVELILSEPMTINWSIVNQNGHQVINNKEICDQGTTTFHFSVSGFASGVYILLIESLNKRVVKKIVVI